MKFLGSKARIANEILPIILKRRRKGQYYVEPFVGGCNSMDKVGGLRLGADNNKYLIALWKGLQDGENMPITITKESYSVARVEYRNETNFEYSDFEIGYIGFMASFNGRFFDGGYSGTYGDRNYIAEQVRNTTKQLEAIKDVEFRYTDYTVLVIPDASIIYCDIPYKGAKQYDTSKNFNYVRFWEWARQKTREGHTVFVSEYKAPEDFKLIWSKEVTNSLHPTKTKRPTEKLFMLR